MADQIIDHLVSSLAAGLIGTAEFIDALEIQAEQSGQTPRNRLGSGSIALHAVPVTSSR
jgi:hypothetical protein